MSKLVLSTEPIIPRERLNDLLLIYSIDTPLQREGESGKKRIREKKRAIKSEKKEKKKLYQALLFMTNSHHTGVKQIDKQPGENYTPN